MSVSIYVSDKAVEKVVFRLVDWRLCSVYMNHVLEVTFQLKSGLLQLLCLGLTYPCTVFASILQDQSCHARGHWVTSSYKFILHQGLRLKDAFKHLLFQQLTILRKIMSISTKAHQGFGVKCMAFQSTKWGIWRGWWTPKFCQTFQISSWMMSKLHNRCPYTFCQELKYAKWVLSHDVLHTFNPWFFYLWCWWERCGYYRPHLEEIFPDFFWPMVNTCPFGMTKGSFQLHKRGL